MPARSLRWANTLMRGLWPPVPLDRSAHDVVHFDGIHLHWKAVVLIAVADGHVIGWHVAGNETCAAWSSLLSRIAPPLAVVCDGGGGVLKALRTVWLSTRVQHCLFHVCMNITELTGLRPRLEAGKSLRKAAVALSRVSDADSAAEWLASYNPSGNRTTRSSSTRKAAGRTAPSPTSTGVFRQGAPDDPRTH